MKAAHANLDVLLYAIDLNGHSLQIGLPAGPGLCMGVRYVIAVHRAFSANITFSGHGFLQLIAQLIGYF